MLQGEWCVHEVIDYHYIGLQYSDGGIGLFALGVFVGSLVWQFGLVFAATITSKFTNHKVQQEIQYSGALLILVLAIVLILW